MSKIWIIEVSVFHNNIFPALTAMGPANAVPTGMLGNHLQSNAAATFQGLPSPGECIHEQSSDGEINQCLGGQPPSRPRESGDSGVNPPPGGVKWTCVMVEEVEDEDAPGGGRHTESFLGDPPRESGDSRVNPPPGGVERTRVTVEEVEDEDAPGGGRHTESFLGDQPRESGDSGVNPPPGGVKRTRVTVEEVEDEDAPGGGRHTEPFPGEAGEPLRRPSEYLRKRCPLCFGGSKQDTEDR
jgi:hypothetical protein